MVKIELVSKGCKMVSIIILTFNILFFVLLLINIDSLLINIDLVNLLLIVVSSLALLYSLVGVFMLHYSRIIIVDSHAIVFYVFIGLFPKKIPFLLREIQQIKLDIDQYDVNMISVITEYRTIKFSGYKSLKGSINDKYMSSEIIALISKKLEN